jgi:hypothetical protein
MTGKSRYCIGCGKRGVHWPKDEPLACSARCLARRAVGEYMGGGDGYCCTYCGPGHTDTTCLEDLEEATP